MDAIRIEGVEFELEDAREFYERALAYAAASPPMSPERQRAVALAGQIRACLWEKGSEVTLWEKPAASTVLAEWVQSDDAPDAARTLYRILAS